MRKSLIMLLATLLAVLPSMGAWPGKVQAAGYVFRGGGDGTPGNPFKIKSAEDLDHVRDDLTASYRLQADIDLSTYGNWEPIGKSGYPFSGTFDGAGYTISGLTIDSNADDIGLFGQAAGAATTIQNVRLVDVDITSSNVNAQVGGLVGLFFNGTIISSSVSGEIDGEAASAGGLAGQISTGAKVSMSSSNVNLDMNGGTYAGGLVGGLTVYANIEKSYATGDVSRSGSGSAGGLVGGLDNSTILDSYATGRVTADSNDSVGGLLGWGMDGTITNSYAVGTVSRGTGSAGGLVGLAFVFSPPSITSTYWNMDANPGLQSFGWTVGTVWGVNENVMKDLVAYAGWDPTIWGIQEGTSYPYLKAFSSALRIDPLSSAYSTETGVNELTLSGSIRDGSIGEPLEVSYIIQNEVDATVTSAVYAIVATGEDQAFHFSTMLNKADYPDGTYSLTVAWKDTVAAHNQSDLFTFVVDSTAPEISLIGSGLIELEVGDTFMDLGATASDTRDGDVTALVTRSGTVDTAHAGTYILTYQVKDGLGNTATKTRTVKVYNSFFPRLLLNGDYTMEVEVGGTFTDPEATASDERDGDVTDQIVITGSVDTGRVGVYSINYLVENSLGYQSSVTRTVKVVDRTPPVLTLLGANPMQIEAGSTFKDPGATAMDAVDGDLTDDITVTGSVYTNQVGTYTLTYKVQDHSGNAAADAERKVNVVRTSSSSSGGGPTGGGQPSGNMSEGQSGGDNAGSTTPPAPGCSFTDLEKHWAKPDICQAAKLGIVEGVSAHTFMPNAAVTRTEFAVMLLRALRIEIDNEAGAVSFSDQDSIPKWATQAIRTAVAKGILTGYPDGTLKPVQTVSRSEMAAMVSRAMNWQAGKAGNAYFSDETSIPAWAKDYVAAARERGVLTGRDGNRFAPDGLTTRAEAAVVLLRLWKVLY